MPPPSHQCSNQRSSLSLFLVTLFLLGLLGGCSPTISPFNARAYDQATSLKVDALALMEEATDPYAEHASDVQRLQRELQKAYEFARGRPQNEISARQWELLLDPERDLIGGFFRDWKEQSSFSNAFVREKTAQVEEAFDIIIELESGKRKPEDVRSP